MSYLSVFARANGPVTPQSPARRQSSISSSESASTPELDRLLDRQTLSPMKRTQSWLEGPSPNRIQSTPDLHKVKGGRVGKTNGQNGKDKRKSFWSLQFLTGLFGKEQDEKGDNELEGDTVVEDEDPISATELDNDFTLVEDNEELIKAESASLHSEELSNQSLSFHNPQIQQRTDEETWLFNKLSRLGREPLLPRSWNMDFPTFPAYLFSSDPARVVVNTNHTTISHAAGAFQDLITAGSHARAQVLRKSPPEKPLFREITKFYKWSQLDGRFKHKHYIPVLAIACARPKESTESVVNRLTDTLHSLGAQYRDKWRHQDCCKDDKEQRYTHELPTLYGLVIKFSVVAVVTCDSSVPKKPIRALATYDWNKGHGQDVWQAFGVAITIVAARNYLMKLDEEGELGEDISESDPDA